MRKAFDVEDLNLDDLIEVAMEDPKGLAGAEQSFRGIDFNDVAVAGCRKSTAWRGVGFARADG